MKKSGKILKMNELAEGASSSWEEDALLRQSENGWRTKASAIALQVLRTLRVQKLSQKQLALRIGVSPQYINKIVKGNENLSLETITKLENALGLPLVTIYVGEQRRVGAGRVGSLAVDYYRDGSQFPERVVELFAHYTLNSSHLHA